MRGNVPSAIRTWAEAHDGRRPSWKYTTAEQFTNEFVEAIRNKKVEAFRKKFDGTVLDVKDLSRE